MGSGASSSTPPTGEVSLKAPDKSNKGYPKARPSSYRPNAESAEVRRYYEEKEEKQERKNSRITHSTNEDDDLASGNSDEQPEDEETHEETREEKRSERKEKNEQGQTIQKKGLHARANDKGLTVNCSFNEYEDDLASTNEAAEGLKHWQRGYHLSANAVESLNVQDSNDKVIEYLDKRNKQQKDEPKKSHLLVPIADRPFGSKDTASTCEPNTPGCASESTAEPTSPMLCPESPMAPSDWTPGFDTVWTNGCQGLASTISLRQFHSPGSGKVRVSSEEPKRRKKPARLPIAPAVPEDEPLRLSQFNQRISPIPANSSIVADDQPSPKRSTRHGSRTSILNSTTDEVEPLRRPRGTMRSASRPELHTEEPQSPVQLRPGALRSAAKDRASSTGDLRGKLRSQSPAGSGFAAVKFAVAVCGMPPKVSFSQTENSFVQRPDEEVPQIMRVMNRIPRRIPGQPKPALNLYREEKIHDFKMILSSGSWAGITQQNHDCSKRTERTLFFGADGTMTGAALKEGCTRLSGQYSMEANGSVSWTEWYDWGNLSFKGRYDAGHINGSFTTSLGSAGTLKLGHC